MFGQMRSFTDTMPLHYVATKYALSVRTKHWALAAARSFSDFPSWESVSPENVEDTAEELREHVTEMVRQDTHSLWLAPAGIPGPPHKESFQTTGRSRRPRPGQFDWLRPGKLYASSQAPHLRIGRCCPLQAARSSGPSVQAEHEPRRIKRG